MPKNGWTILNGSFSGKSGESEDAAVTKVPYVSTWATFSKLDEKTKASLFNAMRAALIESGRMEDKGG